MKAELICIVLLIMATSISGNRAVAESTGKNKSNPESLQYQLEIQRHETLNVLKNNLSNQLNDFTTDGCSGGLSIGWQYLAGKTQKFNQVHGVHPPWESCCVSHDREYHTGGGREISAGDSLELRRSADQLLESCVRNTGAERSMELGIAYGISSEEVEHLYELIASLMYKAVQIGGMPCTGLPWRWGYGWPECE